MSALQKIQQAGFNLWVKENGNIGISPFSKLSDEQCEYIREYKPEILTELEAENDSEQKYKQFVVTRDGESNNVIVCGGMILSLMRHTFAKSTVEILH